MKNTIEQSWFANFFFANKASAPFWFVIRLYVGYEWLMAGWAKVTSAAWVGGNAGAALTGFVQGALAKTGGAHPDVTMWYAWFLQHVVLPQVVAWSYAISFGEVLVGVGLIVGLFTGVAAFFGFFMNLNFLLSGAVSSNPTLLVLSLLLILARRVAGYWGLDRYAQAYFRKHHSLRIFRFS